MDRVVFVCLVWFFVVVISGIGNYISRDRWYTPKRLYCSVFSCRWNFRIIWYVCSQTLDLSHVCLENSCCLRSYLSSGCTSGAQQPLGDWAVFPCSLLYQSIFLTRCYQVWPVLTEKLWAQHVSLQCAHPPSFCYFVKQVSCQCLTVLPQEPCLQCCSRFHTTDSFSPLRSQLLGRPS